MVEIKMMPDKEGYPKNYFYLMGHAFGEIQSKNDAQYIIEPLGRFGTTTEAEAHIDIINSDIQKENGILANDNEFPFLILEIVDVVMKDMGVIEQGDTVKFFIYDWMEEKYIDIGQVSRLDCLGEYQDRILGFLRTHKPNQSQEDVSLYGDRLDMEDF